jgi:hypothetical protein
MASCRAIMLAVLLAGSARAADFSGTYVWTANPAEAAAVTRSISQAADTASFMIRPVVRKKLTDATIPYQSVSLSIAAGVLTFDRNGANRPITAALGGKPIPWEREDGMIHEVSFSLEQDTLRQVFVNKDGSRENAFSWSEDGRFLRMTVTLSASVIKIPVSYTLTYVKNP